MSQPTIQQFKLWCKDHYDLALTVCKAQACAEVTREKVDAYIKPVFDRFEFYVSEKCGDRVGTAGERILSPRDLYLADLKSAAIAEYYAACDAEHKRQGYDDLEPGFCPALIAENLLIEAQNCLMEAANPLFGLKRNPYMPEDREKYLKLLLGACLKTEKRAA